MKKFTKTFHKGIISAFVFTLLISASNLLIGQCSIFSTVAPGKASSFTITNGQQGLYTFNLKGGDGGAASTGTGYPNPGLGGRAGDVTATLLLAVGDRISIILGKAGANGAENGSAGGGGGGSSAICINGNVVLVAGGGGGGARGNATTPGSNVSTDLNTGSGNGGTTVANGAGGGGGLNGSGAVDATAGGAGGQGNCSTGSAGGLQGPSAVNDGDGGFGWSGGGGGNSGRGGGGGGYTGGAANNNQLSSAKGGTNFIISDIIFPNISNSSSFSAGVNDGSQEDGKLICSSNIMTSVINTANLVAIVGINGSDLVIETAASSYTARVFTRDGVLTKEFKNLNGQVSLGIDDMVTGVYFVTLSNNDGSSTHKLIKY